MKKEKTKIDLRDLADAASKLDGPTAYEALRAVGAAPGTPFSLRKLAARIIVKVWGLFRKEDEPYLYRVALTEKEARQFVRSTYVEGDARPIVAFIATVVMLFIAGAVMEISDPLILGPLAVGGAGGFAFLTWRAERRINKDIDEELPRHLVGPHNLTQEEIEAAGDRYKAAGKAVDLSHIPPDHAGRRGRHG